MAPGPAMEILGRIAYEATKVKPLLPTYLHLLLSALFPIYTAAYASLSRPSSAAAPSKKRELEDKSDGYNETQLEKMEGLLPSDAILFPLLAGVTLSSLYFLLKWLQDPAILNKILGYYFAQLGFFFAFKFLKDSLHLATSLLLPTQYSANGKLWKVEVSKRCFSTSTCAASPAIASSSPLPGFLRRTPLPKFVSNFIWAVRETLSTEAQFKLHIRRLPKLKTRVDLLDFVSLLLSAGIVIFHTFVSKPWYLTNFLGFSFCYGTMQYMSPTTSWTGSLLLSALFFYDIYFVFFTPMMVTVATKLDVPIKLLFPKPDGCEPPVSAGGAATMDEYLECIARKRAMAMLGLGDIVIPGMMLAFALRFDLYRYYLKLQKPDPQNLGKPTKAEYSPATGGWGVRLWTKSQMQPESFKAKRFPKTYFHAGVIGYLTGMIMTLAVMQVSQHAQPALLYLVPGVLVSQWGTALVRGDLKLFWEYSEAPQTEKLSKDSNRGKEEKDVKKSDTTTIEEAKDKCTEHAEASIYHCRVQECSETFGSEQIWRNHMETNHAEWLKSFETMLSRTTIESHTLINLSIVLTPLPSNKPASIRDTHEEEDKERERDLNDAMKGRIGRKNSRSDKSDIEELPDITADKAVFAKLTKELSRSCAEIVGKTGDEPPEKRRRKA